LFRVEDEASRDVRGKEVRNELDAMEFQAEYRRKGFGGSGFGYSGNILQQEMSVRGERRENGFQHGLLADDMALHCFQCLSAKRGGFGDLRKVHVRCHGCVTPFVAESNVSGRERNIVEHDLSLEA